MSEGDGSSVHVELLHRDVEQTLVGDGDGRECLVDLKLGDLVDGQASLLECEWNGLSRGDREVDGSAGSVREG